jgi:autotransporter-associated beta strand protein
MTFPGAISFKTGRLLWLTLFCVLLSRLGANDPGDFYTQTGTDLSFQELVDSGVIVVGERFHPGPVLGSTIEVNNALLEQQTGAHGPIPQGIRIHTQMNGSIQRASFPNWTRWYQEDENVQVMRLFEGEQNVRSGIGADGSPGRIEAFFPAFVVEPGTWALWEGTYTIIKPLSSNIFQLFHEGGQLWAFHLRMSSTGSITFNRRREIAGLPSTITIATNMVGRSLSIRVYANGFEYEVFKKVLGEDADWVPVTTGSYTEAVNNRISFRWGMYRGSQPGQTIPNDGLLFVSGANWSVSSGPAEGPSATYYWDSNGAAAGFGNAQGVWSEPTAGSPTQGWSSSAAGTLLPGEVSTISPDSLFFGTGERGLGAGSITVSGSVEAGNLNFGAASGNITLAGGEVAMSGNRLIDMPAAGSTHTIASVLSGSGARTIGGAGTLVLTGQNTFAGPLNIGDNTGNLHLRINSIGNVGGTPSAAGAPTNVAEGIIQLGAASSNSTLEVSGSASPQVTDRRVRLGSNETGSGAGSILNNNSDPAHTLTFTNAAFNVAATNTSSNRIITLGGSNNGDNLIEGSIIDNGGGMVGLTKSGDGAWALTGTSTFRGRTTILGGKLRIGNGGTTGALSPNSNILTNGVLEFRRSNTATQGLHFSGSAIAGAGSVVQSGTGTTIFNTENAYTGPTTVEQGTLALFGAGMASPITVAHGASLGFSPGAPAVSSSSVDLGTGTVRIEGHVDGVSDYVLITAAGGIAGTPTLHEPIPGYQLQIRDGGTRLVLAHLAASASFSVWSGGAGPEVDSSGDGIPNGLAWALGAASPLEGATALLPRLDSTSDPDHLIFLFNRNNHAAADPDTSILVEFTPDFVDWTTATHDGDNILIEVTEGSFASEVAVKFKRSALDPADRFFARLIVTINAP